MKKKQTPVQKNIFRTFVEGLVIVVKSNDCKKNMLQSLPSYNFRHSKYCLEKTISTVHFGTKICRFRIGCWHLMNEIFIWFLVLNVNNFFLINNEIPIPKTKITRLEWGHANFCNATKTNAIIKFRGAGSRGALVISMTFVTIFLRIILRWITFL